MTATDRQAIEELVVRLREVWFTPEGFVEAVEEAFELCARGSVDLPPGAARSVWEARLAGAADVEAEIHERGRLVSRMLKALLAGDPEVASYVEAACGPTESTT